MTGLSAGLRAHASRNVLRTAAENAEWLGEDLAFQRG